MVIKETARSTTDLLAVTGPCAESCPCLTSIVRRGQLLNCFLASGHAPGELLRLVRRIRGRYGAVSLEIGENLVGFLIGTPRFRPGLNAFCHSGFLVRAGARENVTEFVVVDGKVARIDGIGGIGREERGNERDSRRACVAACAVSPAPERASARSTQVLARSKLACAFCGSAAADFSRIATDLSGGYRPRRDNLPRLSAHRPVCSNPSPPRDGRGHYRDWPPPETRG